MRVSIFFAFIVIIPTFGYMVETVTTHCWIMDHRCHQSHSKDVGEHIKKTTDYVYMNIVYVSHSTTSTKNGMHSMIVYK